MDLDTFMKRLVDRHPGQPEFHQSVKELAEDVLPFMEKDIRYKNISLLERMTEPDRIIVFRVCWEDDQGVIQVDRGYRVQFNNSIGPYKGGLRFDPSVNISILKFLGFDQTFKNALTTLPMGGAKGGSNFNPKGRSAGEIMRFCQSFMTGLYRYIGKDIDVPAGDIGCGAREISYMFGQYKRLTNEFTGTMTGKGLAFGGSPIRTEATGYGCVYFAKHMLADNDEGLENKLCVVSGSGNVAQYTTEKLIELGAKVITLSDSSGFIHDPEGITKEKLDFVIDLKTKRHGRIEEYSKEFGCKYYPNQKPWKIPCDCAFPCATQNELVAEDAGELIRNGCRLVCEGANMPTDYFAIKAFQEAKVLYAPGKASNAGGVAISGLEMTQNSMRLTWKRDDVDARLKEIMYNIHEQCVEYGRQENGYINYMRGANIAGFIKVSEAMMAFGNI